ncbi:MAG: 2-hydroxyacid dehydrogenase [Bacillota bacterium]
MKIVCVCDYPINELVMAPIKELTKYGAEVVFLKDEQMQSPKNITEVVRICEAKGADASPANPALVEAGKDADIIVVHCSPVNTEVLQAARKLKCVAVLRSGTENVNEKLCQERGIKIINAPGRSAHAVADFTVGMMIAEARNIARGHMGLMQGKWRKDFVNSFYMHDLRKCTVGIIGAGQIGQKVIERLKGFGCSIIVHDPFVPEESVAKLGVPAVSLEDLLSQSDFVCLHLRLSEKTEKFIGKEQLDLMKQTAFLINTARSGLIDHDALFHALDDGDIGGAALDVFDVEPLPADFPFLQLENVTITPHTAGTSVDTFDNSVEIILDELTNLFEKREFN